MRGVFNHRHVIFGVEFQGESYSAVCILEWSEGDRGDRYFPSHNPSVERLVSVLEMWIDEDSIDVPNPSPELVDAFADRVLDMSSELLDQLSDDYR